MEEYPRLFMNKEHIEIEARFLGIDEEVIMQKLKEAEAEDHGPDMLEEVIFYDKDLKWKAEGKRFIRIRKNREGVRLTYKHVKSESIDGTEEIEISIDSLEKGEALLDRLGFVAFRHQQKKRHSFELDGVKIDIDTWPRIPPYVELEGPSEEEIRKVAEKLGFKWEAASFESAKSIIENQYSIPVGNMKWFTFDKFE
jgi:adenylate cyclase class 2